MGRKMVGIKGRRIFDFSRFSVDGKHLLSQYIYKGLKYGVYV